jgi:elongation factor P
MSLSINDLKSGLTLYVENAVWVIVEAHHIKPGKGAAFTRAKLRNLKSGNIQEVTFRGDEKIEVAYVEERKLQYQYKSGDTYHFMDQENFEEVALPAEAIGEKTKFLKDNLDATAYFYKNDILNINLPNFIVFKIINSEPGIKGDTAKSGSKPAQIETGAIIQVPLFVTAGDNIKVDTRTGTYVERAAG